MYFFLSCCTEKNGVDRSFIWQTIKPAHLTLLFCFINTCVGYHFISIQTGLNRIICSWTEIRHPGFTFTYGRLQRNATLCAGSNLQSFQTNANRWQPLYGCRRLQMLAAAFVSVVPSRADCLSILLRWKPTQRRELTWRPVSRRAGLQQAQSWKLCGWHLEPSRLLLWGTETKCHLHMLEGKREREETDRNKRLSVTGGESVCLYFQLNLAVTTS